MRWTKEEDDMLRSMYSGSTRREIAGALGRTEGAVRSRCWTLGLADKVEPWTDEQIELLRNAYASEWARDLNLSELAARVGKHKTNVCRKARELGLTDQCRRKIPASEKVYRGPMFQTDADRRAYQSETMKRHLRENGHPRGALGYRHSEQTKRKMAESSRLAWADPKSGHNTPEAAERRTAEMYKRIRSGQMRSGYSRSAGGKRPDLGNKYFRSSWEANYARYLNWLMAHGEITGWEFEPKTFEFKAIKRGNRFYTPDFLVRFPDGSHEWHEVKGWMDAASKTRLKRMARYFPEEKVVVVGEKWFRTASRQGIPNLIPNWESNSRGKRGC